jgi:hypothetical protein
VFLKLAKLWERQTAISNRQSALEKT